MSTTAATSHEPVDPFATNRPGPRKQLANTRRPPHPSNPNQPQARKTTKGHNGSNGKKGKSVGALDFIDTLDTISGFHHDGPFDAASSHRNRQSTSKNPARQAPMAAFDPSALAIPPMPSSHPPSTVSNEDHVYPPRLTRRGSDGTMRVSMGYPAGMIASDPKAARLAEAFGIQGREAWEDFGMERAREELDRSPGAGMDGQRCTMSREERDAKTASVWDMEATLKSGKPVPSAHVPHQAPRPDSAFHRGESGEMDRGPSNAPQLKRSKSLMQRIKKGVRSPNLPMESPPLYPEPIDSSYEELASGNGEGASPPQLTPGLGRKASWRAKFGLSRRNLSRS